MKLLSYNIQSWDRNDRRIKGVVDLIKRHNPDLICLQEVTVKWLSVLTKEFSDIYAFCGRDRFHGNKEVPERDKERNCVLFKKDSFIKLYSHTYWYGDDIKHPCITEEAVFNRIFTCVGLQTKDGKQFELISTHLEYTTPRCRELQAQILVNYLKSNNKTTLLAGDFNSPPQEQAYHLVSTQLTDVGKEFGQEDITYHAYEKFPQERIDYIFRSKDVKANDFAIVKDCFEGLPPSDHYPVECLFNFK